MAGKVTKDSPPLENLEPHKCVGWRWISLEELIEIYHTKPELLFDPMLHLIEGILANPSITKNLFD
jgi:hypothetical protein